MAHNCRAEEEPSAQLMEEAVSTKDSGRARTSPRAAAASAQELLVGSLLGHTYGRAVTDVLSVPVPI